MQTFQNFHLWEILPGEQSIHDEYGYIQILISFCVISIPQNCSTLKQKMLIKEGII